MHGRSTAAQTRNEPKPAALTTRMETDSLQPRAANLISGRRLAARALLASQAALPPPRLFRYVDAVGRYGSIRKAAEALHVVSSALNRRILDLEAELGSPLFERLPRGVRPTAAGELFFNYVPRSM